MQVIAIFKTCHFRTKNIFSYKFRVYFLNCFYYVSGGTVAIRNHRQHGKYPDEMLQNMMHESKRDDNYHGYASKGYKDNSSFFLKDTNPPENAQQQRENYED